jgi:hypothetical protein
MENLINQENLDALTETMEDKLGVTANHLLCAGAGAWLLSSGLKMAGKDQAGSLVGKLSVPLIAIGLYKKYKEYSGTSDSGSPQLQTGP